nr:membrane protein [Rhizobium sp. Q54]
MLTLPRHLIVLAMLCLSAASALAEEWFVERSSQQVQYTIDKHTWQPVSKGMTIPNKAWIATGPRGRAVLTRGVETIAIQPQTLAAIITTDGLFSRKTEVVQQKGKLALDIEKRSRPHTYVHTPFLAAVVKGTSFSVTVTDKDASVSVERGLVQVSSFTGGQSTNLGPGQSARVDRAQNMDVAGITDAPGVVSVEPTAASVPAVGASAPLGSTPASGNSDRGDNGSGASGNGSGKSDGNNGNGGGNGGGNNGNGNGGGNSGNGNGNGGGNNGNGNGNGGGNSGNGNGNGGGNSGNGNGNGGGNNGNGNGNGGGNNGNGNGNGGGNNGNGNGNGGGNNGNGNGGGNNGNGNGNNGNR